MRTAIVNQSVAFGHQQIELRLFHVSVDAPNVCLYG